MSALTDLVNISKATAGDLMKAGISEAEQLQRIGSREAFMLIRLHSDSSACLSKLCSLEGVFKASAGIFSLMKSGAN